MSSVCWCSCGVLRETTAAYWACSTSTNASCCNWGSAPMQLSSKDHSYNTTSESSLCAQHALTYQWHGLVFSSRHYSLFQGSRWREDFIFQVNLTGAVKPKLCCAVVVCVFMCLVVPGEVYWQALLLCDLQRTRQFITADRTGPVYLRHLKVLFFCLLR